MGTTGVLAFCLRKLQNTIGCIVLCIGANRKPHVYNVLHNNQRKAIGFTWFCIGTTRKPLVIL